MLKRAIAAIALWAGFGLAHATSVVPLYLDEIIDTASVAFEGVCLENRTGRDPQTGLLATFTTFEVGEVLKGSVGSTYTIKQIGGEDKAEGRHFKIFGVPTFAPGQGYIVFLAGVSPQGFSRRPSALRWRWSLPAAAGDARGTRRRAQSGLIDARNRRRIPASVAPRRLLRRLTNAFGAAVCGS